MAKKRAQEITAKLVLHLVLIHTIFSSVFAMSFNYIHPFTKLTKGHPIWLQTLILSVTGFIIYVILGAIYVAANSEKKLLRIGLQRSVIYFSLGLMTVYALVYFIAQEFHNIDFMLVYCVVNPWFGTFIYKVPPESIFSLWWMVGTIVPGLGMYFGSKMYLKKQGV